MQNEEHLIKSLLYTSQLTIAMLLSLIKLMNNQKVQFDIVELEDTLNKSFPFDETKDVITYFDKDLFIKVKQDLISMLEIINKGER